MEKFAHDIEFEGNISYGRKPNSKSLILDDEMHCTVCPTRFVLTEEIASNSITIHTGYEMTVRALPYWCLLILTLFGVKPDIRMDFLWSVMYDESGFNEYSREDVDKLYVHSLFENSSWLVALLLKPVVWLMIGSNKDWNWRRCNEFTHGHVEPYINYKYADEEAELYQEELGVIDEDIYEDDDED